MRLARLALLSCTASVAAFALTAPAAADHHASTAAAAPAPALSPAGAKALTAAINDPRRAEDRARDMWRHPAETLTFFRVEPTMKVGEYAPGGGWYSRLLGRYVGETGQFVGLFFNPKGGPFDDKAEQRIRDSVTKFPGEVEGWSGVPAARVSAFTLGDVPEDQKGTFDRILAIRMMHNLMRWNIADSELKAIRSLLKEDGMLGIVQHRAKADAPASYADGSKGYLRQKDLVGFVEAHGFELVGTSEINANPKDPADHAGGVWSLPPTFGQKDVDRDRYAAIGESDRMTLLFRKRS